MPLLIRDDACAAMAAEIVEGADNTILTAHDERPLIGDVQSKVIAVFREVTDVPRDLPMAVENLCNFELQQFVAVIAPCG